MRKLKIIVIHLLLFCTIQNATAQDTLIFMNQKGQTVQLPLSEFDVLIKLNNQREIHCIITGFSSDSFSVRLRGKTSVRKEMNSMVKQLKKDSTLLSCQKDSILNYIDFNEVRRVAIADINFIKVRNQDMKNLKSLILALNAGIGLNLAILPVGYFIFIVSGFTIFNFLSVLLLTLPALLLTKALLKHKLIRLAKFKVTGIKKFDSTSAVRDSRWPSKGLFRLF